MFLYEHQHNYFVRELYDINTLLSNVQHSRFKSFFKDFNIDTPGVLNKTNSLHRLKGNTSLTKLTAYLMRDGKKSKALKLILLVFISILHSCKESFFLAPFMQDWRNLHFINNTQLIEASLFKKLHQLDNISFSDNYKLIRNEIVKQENITFNQLLMTTFKKFNFLFSFYIYKVDKQIYKNSRGKSGKYTFVWKYLAPYKRNLLILHWITKEVRISNGKTLLDRLNHVLTNFIFSTKNTWIWKIKKFSLNYVYFNLRRTLGETYRTSMR